MLGKQHARHRSSARPHVQLFIARSAGAERPSVACHPDRSQRTMGTVGSSILILFSLSRGQDAASRSAAQPGGLCDSYAGPTLAWQAGPRVRPARRRCDGASDAAGNCDRANPHAGLTETRHLLGGPLPAELGLGPGLLQAQPALDHGLGKLLSTMNGKSSMMVKVHSVSSGLAVA